MKKLILFLSATVFSIISYSQHFEWAASMGSAQTETLSSVIDKEGNITQVVSWQTAYFTKYDKAYFIYDAFGNDIELNTRREHQLVIVQFDKNGKHNWHKVISKYGNVGFTDNIHLTVNSNNEILIFLHAEGYYRTDDYDFESIIEDKQFMRNKNSHLIGQKPQTDIKTGEDDYHDYETNIKEIRRHWNGLVMFKLSQEGKTIDLQKILPYRLAEPHNAIATKDGSTLLLCSSSKDIVLEGTEIKAKKSGGYILIKLNKQGDIKWAKPFYFIKESCCSYIMPYPQLAQSPNGNIFVAGAMHGGIAFPNGKKVDFKTAKDPKEQRSQFQGFIIAFNASGKMLWQKTTGGRNTIHSITANDKYVYVSGKSRLNTKIFGKKSDTTKGKSGFLAALDTKKGKTKWLKSNGTDGFVALTQDTEGNIYGIGDHTANKHAKAGPKAAYVFETDTLEKTWRRMILASYTDKGEYRWMKNTSSVLYQRQHHYNLLINDCNNLFLVGSAFAGLKIPNQYLDGAFMRGEAYGSMAYLSKIKNNTNKLDTNSLVKNNGSNNPLFQYREVAGKAIEGQEGCGISPGPWQMVVYPNPFSGKATVKIKTTFKDNNVSLILMDMNGKTISTIVNKATLEKGMYTYPIDALANNLRKGTYLVVLRGSATILSERVVYK